MNDWGASRQRNQPTPIVSMPISAAGAPPSTTAASEMPSPTPESLILFVSERTDIRSLPIANAAIGAIAPRLQWFQPAVSVTVTPAIARAPASTNTTRKSDRRAHPGATMASVLPIQRINRRKERKTQTIVQFVDNAKAAAPVPIESLQPQKK